MPGETTEPKLVALTASIVAAYVSNNSVQAADLGSLIDTVHQALSRAENGQVAPAPVVDPQDLRPAVPIKRSVTDEYIICLEDGKQFKSLKRHLRTRYNMTPEQYRQKWNLPHDYPMVAKKYAEARSKLAKQSGLGKRERER
jgi:predicted transcriptional regulator